MRPRGQDLVRERGARRKSSAGHLRRRATKLLYRDKSCPPFAVRRRPLPAFVCISSPTHPLAACRSMASRLEYRATPATQRHGSSATAAEFGSSSRISTLWLVWPGRSHPALPATPAHLVFCSARLARFHATCSSYLASQSQMICASDVYSSRQDFSSTNHFEGKPKLASNQENFH